MTENRTSRVQLPLSSLNTKARAEEGERGTHPVRSCGRKTIPSRIDAGRRLGSVVRGSDGPV